MFWRSWEQQCDEELKEYWEQQCDEELKEYMKKYTNETIRIKSLFRKKEILYTTYGLTYGGLYNPTITKMAKNIIASILMAKCPNIKLVFYNDKKRNDEYRCEKHERMLRYMRSKYPIEF